MSKLRSIPLVRALALSVVASASALASTVTVTSTVTTSGSLYEYNYTIADGTGQLAVLDVAVSPHIAISGITAPGGSSAYQTAYDSVLGLVSFIENNAVFPSTPLSGFIFYSPVGPKAGTFTGTLFDGTTVSGATQAPVAPEPAAFALAALGGAALLIWRKRMPVSATNQAN